MYLLEITETVINKITFLIAFAISALALVKTAQAFAQENSVGKKAVKDMRGDVDKVNKDIEALKRGVEECTDENSDLRRLVQKLDDDIKDILQQVISWYSGQKRGR